MNQVKPKVHVRVPGKVMLAGEYTVLWGSTCIASTVDVWMDFILEQKSAIRNNQQNFNLTSYTSKCLVESTLWDKPYLVDSSTTTKEPLLEAVQKAMEEFNTLGEWYLQVSGNMEVSYGVGSSSAIRIGVLLAFAAILDAKRCDRPAFRKQVFKSALHLQRSTQKSASGYDIATQLVGGVVIYSMQTGFEKNINRFASQRLDQKGFMLFTSKRGAPTTATMKLFSEWIASANLISKWTLAQGQLVDHLLHCLDKGFVGECKQLVFLFTQVRKLQQLSPVFPEALEDFPNESGLDQTWSFKTTGAGGDDMILVALNCDDHAFLKDNGDSPRSLVTELFSKKGYSIAPFNFCATGPTINSKISKCNQVNKTTKFAPPGDCHSDRKQESQVIKSIKLAHRERLS